MRYAHLTGWGAYAPSQILTNHDLERMVDTSDEWIVKRTGIRERRIAVQEEALSDIALPAVREALAEAGADPSEIDRLNILRATHLAMRRALDGLGVRPDVVLVDVKTNAVLDIVVGVAL